MYYTSVLSDTYYYIPIKYALQMEVLLSPFPHRPSFTGSASPRDSQTLLHQAAEGCLPDNMILLLHTDKELANIQDNYGNTALQIACSYKGTQTSSQGIPGKSWMTN